MKSRQGWNFALLCATLWRPQKYAWISSMSFLQNGRTMECEKWVSHKTVKQRIYIEIRAKNTILLRRSGIPHFSLKIPPCTPTQIQKCNLGYQKQRGWSFMALEWPKKVSLVLVKGKTHSVWKIYQNVLFLSLLRSASQTGGVYGITTYYLGM